MARRTPPGVRELKRCTIRKICQVYGSRTPPGVRELKRRNGLTYESANEVAPLPGCVN